MEELEKMFQDKYKLSPDHAKRLAAEVLSSNRPPPEKRNPFISGETFQMMSPEEKRLSLPEQEPSSMSKFMGSIHKPAWIANERRGVPFSPPPLEPTSVGAFMGAIHRPAWIANEKKRY